LHNGDAGPPGSGKLIFPVVSEPAAGCRWFATAFQLTRDRACHPSAGPAARRSSRPKKARAPPAPRPWPGQSRQSRRRPPQWPVPWTGIA